MSLPHLHNYVLTFADGTRWRTGYVYGVERRFVSSDDELSLRRVCSAVESSDDVCADPAAEVELLVDEGGEGG